MEVALGLAVSLGFVWPGTRESTTSGTWLTGSWAMLREENPAKKARMLREKRCDELMGSLEWGQGGSLLRILL